MIDWTQILYEASKKTGANKKLSLYDLHTMHQAIREALPVAYQYAEKVEQAAREYIAAHKLMRVRFQNADDAKRYEAAAKALEDLIGG